MSLWSSTQGSPCRRTVGQQFYQGIGLDFTGTAISTFAPELVGGRAAWGGYRSHA